MKIPTHMKAAVLWECGKPLSIEDGIEVPFSDEAALRILTDYKDLRDYISDISNDIEVFKQEDDEDAEKN